MRAPTVCLTYSLYLLSWIATILLIPLIVTVLSILFVWKFLIVELIVRIWTLNSVVRLAPTDAIFAMDLFWEKPLGSTAVVYVLEGKLDLEQFTLEFTKRILEVKRSTSEFIYQKLRDVPTNIFGYYFWIHDPVFHIENHIKIVKTPFTEAGLKDAVHGWMQSPYPIGKPLWDIRILTTYQPHTSSDRPRTVIIPRLHHAVADGYTFMKMMERLAGNISPVYVPKQRKQSLTNKLKIVSSIPYVILRQYWNNFCDFDWFSDLKSSPDFFISWTSVPLDKWKMVRKAAGVHFSSIGVSLMAGALAKHANRNNVSLSKERIRIVQMTARPGHSSDAMVNHWRFAFLNIPVENDTFKSFLATDQDLQGLTEACEPAIIQWAGTPLITLLPSCFLRPILQNSRRNGVVFSGILNTQIQEIEICSCRVEAVIPLPAPQFSRTGVFAVISNFNQMSILTIAANKDICASPAAVDEICTDMILELDRSILQIESSSHENFKNRHLTSNHV